MLYPIAPASAVISNISSTIVPSNAGRKSISIINTSANTIYLSFGAHPAVVGAGIPITADGGVFLMDGSTYTNVAINAISSEPATAAIQEFE